MAYISVFILGLFLVGICIAEIPKMKQQRLIRELVTFSVIALYGAAITIMASFQMEVPNLNNLWSWIYSPFSDFMKSLLKS